MSVKLDSMIQRELDLPVGESIFWNNSPSVIQMIQNQTEVQIFVGNRLSVTHDGSTPGQWGYVDSKPNPTNDVSRASTAEQLIQNESWLNGPAFLWKAHPEVKQEVQTFMTSHRNALSPLIEHYSSRDRLKRGVAWLLRYKWFLLSKLNEVKADGQPQIVRELSVEEVIRAEREIIASVQKETFKDHFTQRSKSRSPLHKLCPVTIDRVLCIGGHLRNAPITEDAKHPILLPKKHHVTDLIVRKYHKVSSCWQRACVGLRKAEILDYQRTSSCALCVKSLLQMLKKNCAHRGTKDGKFTFGACYA